MQSPGTRGEEAEATVGVVGGVGGVVLGLVADDLGLGEVDDVLRDIGREIGDAPLILTGHLHVAGGLESEGAERRILIGGEHAAPPDIFPDDVAYVALGHLHRPQKFGRETIRYSGSLVPMSKTEIDYDHGVTIVEIGVGETRIAHTPMTRSVAHLRLPARGALSPLSSPSMSRRRWRSPARPSTTAGAMAIISPSVAPAITLVKLSYVAAMIRVAICDLSPSSASTTMRHSRPTWTASGRRSRARRTCRPGRGSSRSWTTRS